MYKVWSSYGGRGLLALAVLLSMGLVGGCGGVGGSDVGEGVALSRSTRIVPNGVSAFAAKPIRRFRPAQNVVPLDIRRNTARLLNASGDL